jgi:transcription elongation factor GreA
MISEPPVLLTEDGLLQLQGELDLFRGRYAELARSKAESPEDVDDGTLTDMTLLQRRMAEIEDVLSRAMPLDGTARVPGVVGIGSRITVHWEGDGEETYTIVDPAEVDLDAGRISHESPVGEALVGRRAGDRVAVNTFTGSMWLSIVSVHS